MKIVINKCYGGFGLSHTAVMRYAELKKLILYYHKEVVGYEYSIVPYGDERFTKDGYYFSVRKIKRDDTTLVRIIEELGDKASGRYSALEIVEIPDGIEWEIDEYDGYETIHEAHHRYGKPFVYYRR